MFAALKNYFTRSVGGDRTLWVVIILLLLFSLVVVYSSIASLAYADNDGQTTDYLIRQIVMVLLGLSTVYIVHKINFSFYFNNGRSLFFIAIILMLLTFVIGVEINGEKRWLYVPGTSFTIQPADFLKIALVIILSMQLASKQKVIYKFKIIPSIFEVFEGKNKIENTSVFFNNTLKIVFPIALSCLLVVITNLSTAIIMYFTCLIILIIGRLKWKEIFKLLAWTIFAFVLIFITLKAFGVGRVETWENRIESFFTADDNIEEKVLDKDEYQSRQAQIAIASGWILGKGPGGSTQRSNLPHPYSDYAYAFIIEEYGVLGGLFLVACFLCIFNRAIVIFNKCESAFPSFLVLGLTLIITIQAMIHMGVSVDILPVTGQPLPVISKGGSSLLFTCAMFGIILGISREINEKRREKKLLLERKLIEEEWQQIILENKDIESQSSENMEVKRKFEDNMDLYNGVIWNETEEDKDNR